MVFKADFRGVAVLVGMVPGKERKELVERLANNRTTDNRPAHNPTVHHNPQRGSHREIALASDWNELDARASRLNPRTIVFDDGILPADTSLGRATRRLAVFAPVTVLASSDKQS